MIDFIIGRDANCSDLTVDGPNADTVSKGHANLTVLAEPGRFYLLDRDSTNGTFVYANGRWESVGQREVGAADRIKFGEYETTPLKLWERYKSRLAAPVPEEAAPAPSARPPSERASPPSGKKSIVYRRNPETGAIEVKPESGRASDRIKRDPETGEIIY